MDACYRADALGNRILVVQNDEAMADALEAALAREGLETISAFDEASALLSFRREEPDAVLLAVELGSISGVDLCRKLRDEPRGPLVPILFIGGSAEGSSVRSAGDALTHGGDYYFRLPEDIDDLAGRIRAWTTEGETLTSLPARAPSDLGVDLLEFEQESVTDHNFEPSSASEPAKDMVRQAETLRAAGRMKEAIEVYSAAAEMYETEQAIGPALAIYKMVLHLNPAEFDVARHAGQLALSAGQDDDALEIFRRGADALEARGQLDNASFLVHEMVRIAPDDPSLLRRLEELSLALGDIEEGEPPPKESFDDLIEREIGRNVAKNTLDLAMLPPGAPGETSSLHRVDLFEGFVSIVPRDLDGDETVPPDRKPANFFSIAFANQKTASEAPTSETGLGDVEAALEGSDPEIDFSASDTLHLLRDRKKPAVIDAEALDGEIIPLENPKPRPEDEETVDARHEPRDGSIEAMVDEVEDEAEDEEIFDGETFEGGVPGQFPEAVEPPEPEMIEAELLDEPPVDPSGPGPATPAHPTSLAFGSLRAPLENPSPEAGEGPGPTFGGSAMEVEISAEWDGVLEKEEDAPSEMTFEKELDPVETGEMMFADRTEPHPTAEPDMSIEPQSLAELAGWTSESAKVEPLNAVPISDRTFEKGPLTIGGWSRLPVWSEIEDGPAAPSHRLSELPAPSYGRGSIIPSSRLVPVEGTLGSLVEVVKLLSRIEEQRSTGILEVAGAPRLVCIEGQPAALRGHRSVHAFLALLLQSGKVDQEACRDLMKNNQSERPVEIGRLFVRNGLLREQEGTVFLHRHFEDGLTVLLRQHGAFAFDGAEDAEVVREEIVPEVDDVRHLLIELLPRIAGTPELLDAIGGPKTRLRVVALAEDAPGRDARFLGILDGRYDLDEAARLVAVPPERAAALGFVYVTFGLATVIQRPKRRGALSWIPLSQPTGGEEVLSAPPVRRPPPRPTSDLDDLRGGPDRLRALESVIRTGDYFEILGVDRGATAGEVEEAHRSLMALIEDDEATLDPELASVAREVRRSLDEARDVLVDPELRRAYEQHLK
jgi:DNA-binding response OmpR family regulator